MSVSYTHLPNVIVNCYSLGFKERTKGSHRIFSKTGVFEIMNLQPLSNGKAKPYQVRQVRAAIVQYKL